MITLPKANASDQPDYEQLVEQARKASELLKALSHETRLLILCMLSEDERPVSEIEALIQLPQAKVSQQLARLRSDKLVATRREGRQIHYRMADSNVNTVVASLYDIFRDTEQTIKMSLPTLRKGTTEKEFQHILEQARDACDLMKALSHETRLLLLCLLTEKEMSVSELEETIGLSQAAISQQLARLRLERLVSARREGRQIYYKIVDTRVNSVVESLYTLFCKPVRDE